MSTTDTPHTLPVGDIKFVKELYPRYRQDDDAIERYRLALEYLPPITVARGEVLVDGFHRWQAHKREGIPEIEIEDLGDLTDAEIFNESLRRNATHGQQLLMKDKANAAAKLWQTLSHRPTAERITEIVALLAVSVRTVQEWTKDARKYEKEQQQAKAWDLWLDCHTQSEIAAAIDVEQRTVSNWLEKSAKLRDLLDPPESRQHFDVWNFQDGGGNSSYFGRMPPAVVENLLWLFTEPGQVVVDPFAGGGTTIDVAKAMGRRVWASDRKPSTPTLPIHEHDITTGWPAAAPRKADLVLLDPPYWKQAAGKYSDDAADLGNMDLDGFMAAWSSVVKVSADHLSPTGRLAFIVSPAQDGTMADGRVVDLAFEMYRVCADHGLTVERRVIVTYSTQQATGQQVTAAREHRKLLKLYRDLVVLR